MYNVFGCDHMRIISGKYKGKVLEGFDIDGTRPTMDRVKESMFAMIQNHLKDCICLDLFAGSGNLGLEALSEGARKCYFVDCNPIAIRTIRKNGEACKALNDMEIVHKTYREALLSFQKEQLKFNLVFLDPPYQENLISTVFAMLKELDLLEKDALIVCEFEHENLSDSIFHLWKERKYGSKKVFIYRV